jgi:flavin reductase (DIM6/NTAB) family NADH-FMN oxidoreductase RutF
VTDESFDELMGMLDYPLFLVTAQADGLPSGCLVSFATQASVQPPRFIVSMSRTNHTFGVASRSGLLAVHVLPRRHRALAELFGSHPDDQINKFDRCSWRAGPEGVPILDEAVAWFVGRTVDRGDVGDHVLFVLEPVAVWAPESSEDLLYLGDVDDIDLDDGGPPRSAEWEQGEVTRRFGLKFTLGGL